VFWSAIGLLLAVLPGAFGSAPPARFMHLSVEQGLSQSTVQVTMQDHVGFLWFGTEEGLNRYDGYSFAVFRHDPKNPASLPNDKVTALLEDRRRQLWIGTDAGLSLFDRRTETFVPEPTIRGRVTDLAEAADGTLWIGVEGYGLYERHPATGAFIWHQKDARNPASFQSYVASVLLFDRRGRLWIGTRDAGLALFEKGDNFIHYRHDPADPQSLAHNEVWGLAEDPAGNLWVATYGGGLSVRDPATGTFRHYRHRADDPHSLGTDLTTSVFTDRSGALWVGTDGAGVQRYDATTDRFRSYQHDPADSGSLSQNVIRSFFEDRQDQLWVGTYLGGVDLLKRPRHDFGYYTHVTADPTSLSDPTVSSFLEDAAGRIWVGMERGWLDGFDPRNGSFTHYRFPSDGTGDAALLALHQDRRGRIWVGTYRDGLGRFDPATGTFVTYPNRSARARTSGDDEIWTIAEDPAGLLWLGTNNGVDRFDPDTGRILAHFATTNAEGQSSAGVRALLYDRQGNLWVGTHAGLNRLPPGSDRFVRYRHDERDPHSLSHDSVVALAEDRQGRLWVGTYGEGVNLLDAATGTFTAYKGFPSKVVYRIEEDLSGHLWVSTNQGLSRFDPATGAIENFDLTNGLQGLQFHLGASRRTRDGRLLFGSADGFYFFDPATIRPDRFVPPVVLTALRVFNEPLPLPAALASLREVTLSAGAKVFSLEFAALDYTFPRHNRYAYAMENLSERWLDLGNKREVTFTSLAPGTYVFRVKASNSDGVWSDASATALRVIVEPPVWSTWWFRGALVIALGLALGAIHRARVRRLTVDIAEQKRAEEKLRASEKRFSTAFHASPTPMTITRLEDGSFLDINDSFLRLLGYRHEEVIDRAPEAIGIVSEEDGRRLAKALLAGRPVRELEIVFRTKTYEERTTQASFDITELDGQRCALGSIIDVTERKRVEMALRESEDRYRRFFEEDLAGIFFATPAGRILTCNPAFVRIFGFESVPAALAHDLATLFPDPLVWAELWAMLEQKEDVRDYELELRRQDGKPVHVIANAIGSRDPNGELIAAKGYVVDVTERKKLEGQLRQAQKMEAIGQLAGGVAHDFNNLLTAILGHSELLLDGQDQDSSAYADVVEIRNAAQRAAALTRQLLAFSRKQVLQPQVLDLNGLVTGMGKMLRTLIGEDVRLEISLEPTLGRIKADPGQIEQIVLNLAVNARDAMPRGGQLTITTANLTLDEHHASQLVGLKPGPFVRLTVNDTGTGMDAEVQAHLFEPFFTTKGVGKGTGLGLSTVYGIVQQSNGHINVYSELDMGTTFKIYFPCVESAELTAEPATAALLPTGTGTVLLVEDNEVVRKIAHQILQRSGYAVLEAVDGEDALRRYEQHPEPIRLLLTDVIMPGINGRELAERLAARHPTMKVLFMSGYTDDVLSRHGGLGLDTAFLEKPFTCDALLLKIHEVLDRPTAP
jgi:PAS domain S-box-containing protein